ncbi:MAG: helix-turn-helix domain-containing protein [Verrucomicrobia bacterium]|nr:helix-turn-helix domain-containing protein [Cytophagales bacterium]
MTSSIKNRALRLAELRRKSGFTLREIAQQVGISHGRIDAYESDAEVQIKKQVLEKLAHIYQTSVEYIEYGIHPAGKEGLSVDIAEVGRYEEKQIARIRVPVMPLSATASFIENHGDGFHLVEAAVAGLEKEWVEKVSGVRYHPYTMLFRISNNSMHPNYKHTGKVLCSWVDNGNWLYVRGVHVISTRTGMLLLKRIKSLQDGKLLLSSDNPEYGDLWLPLEDVLAIWKAEYKTYEPAE